ncbi:MAG: 23S rRNA (pseudouridine(1915)-N(3))-methyltransferase RlmH [Gammaproteobacteria bacterium]|nr:MAG: 23S rRNA (pseudouridine(1915)-N(3))-methyltransferase RlmH [Gammaproteobacteria bacterium]
MRISLISAANRMPDWVNSAVKDYQQRLGKDIQLQIVDIPLNKRGKNANITKFMEKEGQLMLRAAKSSDHLIALDVKGTRLSTEKMSAKFNDFLHQGVNIALLMGGPEGLSEQCKQACKTHWSLSDLTLPHPLARVLVTEQIYRCWSILHGHPYHK